MSNKILGVFVLLSFFCVLFFAERVVLAGSTFSEVKPILMNKCATCHATEVKRPFSSKIPIWNHATGTNIGLARKKYDMNALLESGDAADDYSLIMLEQVVRKKSMPPIQYKLIHPSSRLSEEEQESILNWIYLLRPNLRSLDE